MNDHWPRLRVNWNSTYIEQIGNSNERIMKGENDLLEKMSRRMSRSFDQFREEHNTRMKNVMNDIRDINASMVVRDWIHNNIQ